MGMNPTSWWVVAKQPFWHEVGSRGWQRRLFICKKGLDAPMMKPKTLVIGSIFFYKFIHTGRYICLVLKVLTGDMRDYVHEKDFESSLAYTLDERSWFWLPPVVDGATKKFGILAYDLDQRSVFQLPPTNALTMKLGMLFTGGFPF